MKRALVSGDRGFVGKHFRRHLTALGWDVYGCDVRGKDPEDCRVLFKQDTTRYDLVVHLAAIVGGRQTIEGDPLKVATDLSIDAEMFNWAVRTGQPRVVYYSSSAAYPIHYQDKLYAGRLYEEMIRPDEPMMPDFTYGWAKLTGEMLAGYARSYGTKVHVLRPFSGYGPGQPLDYPFPSFAERARQRADPFEVWGPGTQQRDFIHINDVIEGTMAVVDADCELPVNLCTGRAVSFNQLAEMFGARNVKNHLDQPVGVFRRVGDTNRMSAFYTPKITLEQGIQEALRD